MMHLLHLAILSIISASELVNAMDLESISHPIWVETVDSHRFTIPESQVSQIEKLQQVASLREQNSYTNPFELPYTTKNQLELVQNALTALTISEDNFYKFHANLTWDNQRELDRTAHQLQATTLNSMIEEAERKATIARLTKKQSSPSSVIAQQPTQKPTMAQKILNLYGLSVEVPAQEEGPIITLPSAEVLNQRLTENGFGFYMELGKELGGITGSVLDITLKISFMIEKGLDIGSMPYLLMLMNKNLVKRFILQNNPEAIKYLEKEGLLRD